VGRARVQSQRRTKFLKNGDVIRLQHPPTTRNLHSHVIPASITKLNYEVSCYGNLTIGDFHDQWVVEVVDDVRRWKGRKGKQDPRQSGLWMISQLPMPFCAGGFKQIEVSRVKDNDPFDPHTYWNVESHWNDRRTWDKLAHNLFSCALARIGFPLLTSNTTSPHSCATFWHLTVAMMTSTNHAFVPDPDKHDILADNPMDWPWLRLGMCMCGWGNQQQKYYLLGTPIVWWGGTYTQPVRVCRAARHLPSSPTANTDMDSST